MNRMTVTKDGRHLGSVTTLRDRTELSRLEREIGGDQLLFRPDHLHRLVLGDALRPAVEEKRE